MQPLVSIIIPVYNKEKWIVQTLQSIAAQTYENWECLIVDDGSTDNSLRLINSFTNIARGNWRIFSQVNSGQSKARNAGIDKAIGEFVAFLDGDDLWLADKLREQVDTFIQQPEVEAIISGFAIFEVDQSSGFRVVTHKSANRMLRGWMNMRGFGGLIESTGIVKRSTLSRVGKFDEELSTSAGLDLGLRLLTDSNLVTIPKPHVLYRLSNDQWHRDEHELRKNVDTLAEKYSAKVGGLSQIHKWHNSYFFWLEMATAGNFERVRSVFFSFLTLRIRDWLMFLSLVSRNVLAKLRGKRIEKKLTEYSKADRFLNWPK